MEVMIVDRITKRGWKMVSIVLTTGMDAYAVREGLTMAIEALEKALPDNKK